MEEQRGVGLSQNVKDWIKVRRGFNNGSSHIASSKIIPVSHSMAKVR